MALRTRRFSRRGRPSSPRRQLVWARTVSPVGGLNVVAGTATGVSLLADYETFTGANVVGATIMAIRGRVQVFTGVTPSLCVSAIRVCTRQGFATAGGPATTGRYDDWMWMAPSWAGPGTQPFPNHHVEGDLNIRSRRKLREADDGLFIFFETLATSTASTAMYHISTLLALP